MRKILLGLLLIAISTSAMAEWTPVVSSNNAGGYYIYANYSSIRQDGTKVKMWSLYDFNTIQSLGEVKFSSIKFLDEYDCQGEQSRTLSSIRISGNMGNGDVVGSNNTIGQWSPISPDSVIEVLWKTACKKK